MPDQHLHDAAKKNGGRYVDCYGKFLLTDSVPFPHCFECMYGHIFFRNTAQINEGLWCDLCTNVMMKIHEYWKDTIECRAKYKFEDEYVDRILLISEGKHGSTCFPWPRKYVPTEEEMAERKRHDEVIEDIRRETEREEEEKRKKYEEERKEAKRKRKEKEAAERKVSSEKFLAAWRIRRDLHKQQAADKLAAEKT